MRSAFPHHVALVALVAAWCMLPGSAPGASSGTVVSAFVPSATTITPSCATGTAAAEFGTVLPGASTVTTADCTVSFSSSNDTATLLASQTDGATHAMGGSPTGSLDPAFAGGTATFPTSVVSTTVTFGGSDVQSNGMMLVSTSLNQSVGNPFDVRRVRLDGTLDPGFGTLGVASIPMAAGATGSFAVESLPDGKVLVCGFSDRGLGAGNDVAFARLLADGTLDPSFGVGGRAYVTGTNSTDLCYDMVVRADGRIVFTGSFMDVPNNQWDMIVGQLLPDGTPDTTFGSGGIARVELGGPLRSDYGYAVALAADGAIVVAGATQNGTWNGVGTTFSDIGVAVLTAGGAADDSFNGSGQRTVSHNATDIAVAMTLQRDGDILVSGRTLGATWDGITFRLLRTGALDPSFNGNAPRIFDNGGVEWAGAALEDAQGRILQSMSWSVAGVERTRLLRMDSLGADDLSFGTSGASTVLVGDSTNKVRALYEIDGVPTLIGYGTVAGRAQPIIVRYAAPSIPDFSGSADWLVGANGAFGICTRLVTNAAAVWTEAPGNACTAANGAHWRAVPRTVELPAARVATTALSQTGVVRFRFGLRVDAAQAPSSYGAPITFSVVAPQA